MKKSSSSKGSTPELDELPDDVGRVPGCYGGCEEIGAEVGA